MAETQQGGGGWACEWDEGDRGLRLLQSSSWILKDFPGEPHHQATGSGVPRSQKSRACGCRDRQGRSQTAGLAGPGVPQSEDREQEPTHLRGGRR